MTLLWNNHLSSSLSTTTEEEVGYQQDDKQTTKIENDPPDTNSGVSHQIYIGNIDWSVPVDEVIRLLNLSLLQPKKMMGQNEEGIKEYNVKSMEIRKKTNKARDKNKCHGGSAIISFEDISDAQIGMNQLTSIINCSSTTTTTTILGQLVASGNVKDLKIRWTLSTSKQKTNSSTTTIGKKNATDIKIESSSEETLQLELHRKMRAEKYARKRKLIAKKTRGLIASIYENDNHDDDGSSSNSRSSESVLSFLHHIERLDRVPHLDWSSLPNTIDPMRGGGLKHNTERGLRKQAQVEAMLHVLVEAILTNENNSSNEQEHFVYDCGSGAGNLSLPLAYFLNENYNSGNILNNKDGGNINMMGRQKCKVICVDINAQALERLANRGREAGLDLGVWHQDLLNLILVNPNTENTTENFMSLPDSSTIVSLHGCGAASDLAMEIAVKNSCSFAISPCCIGKINSVRLKQPQGRRMPSLSSSERSGVPTEYISYPRSKWLLDKLTTSNYEINNDHASDNFKFIASAADYSVIKSNLDDTQEMARYKIGRLAKRIIETDRLQWASERGYDVRMVDIPSQGPYYPKVELLLGAKRGTEAADRISALSTKVIDESASFFLD